MFITICPQRQTCISFFRKVSIPSNIVKSLSWGWVEVGLNPLSISLTENSEWRKEQQSVLLSVMVLCCYKAPIVPRRVPGRPVVYCHFLPFPVGNRVSCSQSKTDYRIQPRMQKPKPETQESRDSDNEERERTSRNCEISQKLIQQEVATNTWLERKGGCVMQGFQSQGYQKDLEHVGDAAVAAEARQGVRRVCLHFAMSNHCFPFILSFCKRKIQNHELFCHISKKIRTSSFFFFPLNGFNCLF